MKNNILIIDDEPSICYSLKKILDSMDIDSQSANTTEDAISILKKQHFEVILLDNHLNEDFGLDLIPQIKNIADSIIIMMTAFPNSDTAIEATKRGAFEFILKPFDIKELKETILKAVDLAHVNHDKVQMMSTNPKEPHQDAIIGKSRPMQNIYKLIGQIADKDVTVLIHGETGTGKELIARAVHQHSQRKDKIFMPINCAAIPQDLLESELFGHEKGAFTGAQFKRIGKFEQCHEGTIFLDEIGDLDLSMQAKILRLIQDQSFQRVGGNETIKTNVRIIAATNVDLNKAIKQNKFREDLYYRLSVISIELPTLADRIDDLEELAQYFLQKFISENQTIEKIKLSEDAFKKLYHYHWPGNIRELENVIKRAVLTCKQSMILENDIDLESKKNLALSHDQPDLNLISHQIFQVFLKESDVKKRQNIMEIIEKNLIINSLKQCQGNQVHASNLLGMNRTTFRKKTAKYNLAKEVQIIEDDSDL